MVQVQDGKKLVLFLPINSAGHVNSSLAIADRLRQDHQYATVFLLSGPPPSQAIQSHGHQLIQLKELDVYEDYEVEADEDTSKPIDVELKQQQGKSKRRFEGANKWPQITARYQHLFKGGPLETYKSTAYMVGHFLMPSVIANTPLIEREIERLQPDLIVSDMYLPPPLVLRDELERPWVRLHSSNPLVVAQPKPEVGFAIKPTSRLWTKEERQRIKRDEPQRWQAMLDEWRHIGDQIGQAFSSNYKLMRDFYQANNCDRLDSGKSAIASPHLNVYMFPEAIDYDQDDDLLEYPPRWLRCDSLIRKSAGELETAELRYWSEVLEQRLCGKAEGTKVIFFSLGSIASGNLNLMKKFMEILADDREERLYVVSKGVNGDNFELNERNMIGGNYIPQTFFLERADLAIIHGGNNSITECLYYGLPTIVLPNFSDQFDNAQRIEDLKLGRALNVHECSGLDLLGAIDDLLADDQLRAKLRTIAKRMQARDELGKLSELLSRLVETKQIDEELARKYNIKL